MKAKLLCTLLAASLVMTSCTQAEAQETSVEAEEVSAVDAVKPVRGDIAVSGEFMGTLEPEAQTYVASKMSGEVTETFFEEGDHVEQGDLLFTLDDTAAKLQVENAQATYNTAVAGAAQNQGSIDVQRASAENSVATADESIQNVLDACDTLSDTYNDVQNQINEMEDSKDDLKKAAKQAEAYYKKVTKASSIIGKCTNIASQYAEVAEAAAAGAEAAIAEAAALKAQFLGYFSEIVSEIGGTAGSDVDPAASHAAEYNAYIAAVTGNPILTMEGLSAEVSTARNNMNSANSAISSVESGISSLETQKDSINNSKRSTALSYDQAVRGKEIAQKNLDYYNNYTAPGTIATSEAALRQAQVGVDSAKLQLDYTRITAPVSGTIESITVEKYGMAQAGNPVVVITNKDNMVVNFGVSERIMKTLKEGQTVTVERNGAVYSGTISEIPLNMDMQSGLFVIKAVVHAGGGELISGTSVKVTTDTDQVKQALTIPVDAVYYDSSDAYVYTVESGVVRKTPVETGIFDDEKIEIISGLSVESVVVTSWSSELRDGLGVSANCIN